MIVSRIRMYNVYMMGRGGGVISSIYDRYFLRLFFCNLCTVNHNIIYQYLWIKKTTCGSNIFLLKLLNLIIPLWHLMDYLTYLIFNRYHSWKKRLCNLFSLFVNPIWDIFQTTELYSIIERIIAKWRVSDNVDQKNTSIILFTSPNE